MIRVLIDRGEFRALDASIRDFDRDFRREVRRELLAVARVAAGDVRARLRRQSSRAARRARGRTGSLPGQPPATFTGALARSVAARLARGGRLSAFALSGGGLAPHAHLLEYGTRLRRTRGGASRGVLAPRPFMEPAARAAEALLRPRLEAAADRAVDRFLAR